MSVLADLGGVIEIFLFGFVVFCNYVNQKQLTAKSIRAIYFQADQENHGIKHLKKHNENCNAIGEYFHRSLAPIKFTIWDKISDLKQWFTKDTSKFTRT